MNEKFHDYQVYHKNNFVGVFRDYNECSAIKQAWEAMGYAPCKFSSCIKSEFSVIKLGML